MKSPSSDAADKSPFRASAVADHFGLRLSFAPRCAFCFLPASYRGAWTSLPSLLRAASCSEDSPLRRSSDSWSSDQGTRRRSIVVHAFYFSRAGELVLWTIHLCEGTEALVARRNFRFAPDLNALARAAFFILYGAMVWVLYCLFIAEHCHGVYSVELSIFGAREGLAVVVLASRWQE